MKETLKILHALADQGVFEQVIGDDCQVRWRLKRGGEKKFKQLRKQLLAQ